MPYALPIQPFHQPRLEAHVPPRRPIRVITNVKDTTSALGAEVTVYRVSRVGGPLPDGELGGKIFWKRQEGVAGEVGRGAEGGAGLEAAFGAVAVGHGDGAGAGRCEGDVAALAGDGEPAGRGG